MVAPWILRVAILLPTHPNPPSQDKPLQWMSFPVLVCRRL